MAICKRCMHRPYERAPIKPGYCRVCGRKNFASEYEDAIICDDCAPKYDFCQRCMALFKSEDAVRPVFEQVFGSLDDNRISASKSEGRIRLGVEDARKPVYLTARQAKALSIYLARISHANATISADDIVSSVDRVLEEVDAQGNHVDDFIPSVKSFIKNATINAVTRVFESKDSGEENGES